MYRFRSPLAIVADFGNRRALGITCFSAGMKPFVTEFGLTNAVPEEYVAAFSLYIFGIVFAPYWVSETHALFEASSLEVCLRQSLRY